VGLTPQWVCQERHPWNTWLSDECALSGELRSRLLADRGEEREEDEWQRLFDNLIGQHL